MIGNEIKESVFRDTAVLYHSMPEDAVARQIIRFTRRHAGQTVLDLGCATGNYSVVLQRLGYTMTGADVNPSYVQRAKERGIEAVLITDGKVPLPDKCVDTVVCFEVLEHVPNPSLLLSEAARLARKNVLFTTPNSEHVMDLQREGLLFEHFAELDHKNFFTERTFRELLQPYFTRVTVKKGDGINPLALIGFRPLRLAGKALTKLGILRPRYHFRLFAVCETI